MDNKSIFTIVFSIFALSFGVYGSWYCLRAILKGIKSYSWPLVNADIIESSIHHNLSQGNCYCMDYYTIEIKFKYNLRNEDIYCSAFSFKTEIFLRKKSAELFLNNITKGEAIFARYNPNNFRDAILVPGTNLRTIVEFIVSTGYIFMGAYVLLSDFSL